MTIEDVEGIEHHLRSSMASNGGRWLSEMQICSCAVGEMSRQGGISTLLSRVRKLAAPRLRVSAEVWSLAPAKAE